MNTSATPPLGTLLRVDDEFTLEPIRDLLKDVPEGPLLISVNLEGGLYDGKWMVQAIIGGENVGSIWCTPDTDRKDVLPTAKAWIDDSPLVTSIHGDVHELKLSEEAQSFLISGIVLVQVNRP